MSKIKKLFGSIEMTWPKVIIMAVITAEYTALINQVPFLKDTSFQDIAICLECWILFAVIIVVNCKKWWEASLKCFVFFLISQPLIYLIEVPFVPMGWGVFQYYKYWFIITVLTLPGAAIAYQLKRKDWLSVLVLSVANGYLAYQGVEYIKSAVSDFPHHLLSAIFCFALALFFVFIFLEDKKHRIAAVAVIVVVAAVCLVLANFNAHEDIELGEGNWSCSVEDESVVKVEITEGGTAELSAKHDGHTYVFFKDADGKELEYYVTVSGRGIYINTFD